MEIFSTWQFYLLVFYLSSIVFTQCFRYSKKYDHPNGVSMVVYQLYSIVTLALFIPFFPWQFSNNPKLYLLLFMAILFYTVNDRLQTTARRNLEVAVIAMINRLFTILLFVSGFIIFGESVSKEKLIGVGLIILANILVLYKKGKFNINRNIVFAFVSVLAFSVAFIIDVGISDNFNLPFYLILIYFFPSLIVVILEKLKLKKIFSVAKSNSGRVYIGVGVASAVWMLCAIRSLQLGEVTVVAPLQSIAVFLNVIVAYFFLKERENIIKKVVAATLVVAAVIILSSVE